ncbi:MAG: hypothetical protein JO056_05870 [Alphaproteobacteria bacterium]|uniref:hypothetical protein n=1 Tax=Bradyrhizobium sp. TaxID=376 RepID=UPI001ED17D12|nr:hypothetical protein [Bradyrhizobium sp.]MBV9570749.1 hypothetical protein [Alphaproteobacteria bacterium]MBV9979000.1 hypothetical protein [Bradyrhizobium sp.]
MLLVGTNKLPILDHLPNTYLLIDDGPIIDSLTVPQRRKIIRFDYNVHRLNPLKGINYRRARDFIGLLDAVFPEGENTITKKNANFVLLKALLSDPERLDRLVYPSTEPAEQDAYQKIQTLLLSPVLNNVLCGPTNFPMKGILIARLNRAELGDFDCFVLGNLLMQFYPGHVVIPDFGFYAVPSHADLIRQGRLTAGLNFLNEVPSQLRNHLLLMEQKIASRATSDDAEVLAVYSGLARGTVAFTDYVQRAIR